MFCHPRASAPFFSFSLEWPQIVMAGSNSRGEVELEEGEEENGTRDFHERRALEPRRIVRPKLSPSRISIIKRLTTVLTQIGQFDEGWTNKFGSPALLLTKSSSSTSTGTNIDRQTNIRCRCDGWFVARASPRYLARGHVDNHLPSMEMGGDSPSLLLSFLRRLSELSGAQRMMHDCRSK